MDIAIRLKPEPDCPACGETMVLRRPRLVGKQFRPFWSCPAFPDCVGKREIDNSGIPAGDDEEESLDDMMMEDDNE